MKRRTAIQSAVIGTVAAAVPQARAAGRELEIFLARREKAKDFTLQVADASYDLKPKAEMRGYGRLMQHIGANNAFYISRFKAGEIRDSLQPPEKFDKETTHADVYLREKGITPPRYSV